MFEWLGITGLADTLLTIAAVLTAGGVIWAVWLKFRKWYMSFTKKVNRFYESVAGTEAVHHPLTGAVVVPPIPPLATRLHTMEQAVATLANQKDTFEAYVLRHDDETNQTHNTMWVAINNKVDKDHCLGHKAQSNLLHETQ